MVKHSAVESALGYHFAKTGRIDPKYHRLLINARKIREVVDYDIQEEVIDQTALLKIEDGREFRWTKSYGGMTIKIKRPIIQIPMLASHPNIRRNPVKVKIWLIKEFFKKKSY